MRHLLVAVAALTAVATPLPSRPAAAAPAAIAAAAGPRTSFVAVPPARVLDTRASDAALQPNQPRTIDVAGSFGVPVDAIAVVVDVVATQTAGPGWLAAWPAGTPWPGTSTVNWSAAGATSGSLATVTLRNGAMDLQSMTATHVVIDVVGAYVPASGPTAAGRLVPMTPTRAFDSRDLGVPVDAGSTVDISVPSVEGFVPDDAIAAVLNVVVTDTSGPGFLTAYPTGTPRPATSSLNWDRAGATTSNQAIVGLHDTAFSIYVLSSTDVVVDVVGWMTGPSAPASTDGLFQPVVPQRLLDTRAAAGPTAGSALDARRNLVVAPPVADASALVGTLTAVGPALPGFVTAWAATLARPTASALNAGGAGGQTAGQVTVPMSHAGIALYSNVTSHFVFDLTGYYVGTPSAALPAPVLPEPPVTGPHAFLSWWGAGELDFARWDPCSPIDYRVERDPGTPAFWRASLDVALGQITRFSGLRFVDRTDDPAAGAPPLTISFTADVDRFPSFAIPNAGGWGGVVTSGHWVVQGQVAINNAIAWQPGWGRRGLVSVAAHELAHAVGLDHVSSPSEIMYPSTTSQTGFGDGDIEGLFWVGTALGCRT